MIGIFPAAWLRPPSPERTRPGRPPRRGRKGRPRQLRSLGEAPRRHPSDQPPPRLGPPTRSRSGRIAAAEVSAMRGVSDAAAGDRGFPAPSPPPPQPRPRARRVAAGRKGRARPLRSRRGLGDACRRHPGDQALPPAPGRRKSRPCSASRGGPNHHHDLPHGPPASSLAGKDAPRADDDDDHATEDAGPAAPKPEGSSRRSSPTTPRRSAPTTTRISHPPPQPRPPVPESRGREAE